MNGRHSITTSSTQLPFRVMACNTARVERGPEHLRFFHRPRTISAFVPGVMRGRFSGIALGAVPAPPPSGRAAI